MNTVKERFNQQANELELKLSKKKRRENRFDCTRS
jgi:hypothetical protein